MFHSWNSVLNIRLDERHSGGEVWGSLPPQLWTGFYIDFREPVCPAVCQCSGNFGARRKMASKRKASQNEAGSSKKVRVNNYRNGADKNGTNEGYVDGAIFRVRMKNFL